MKRPLSLALTSAAALVLASHVALAEFPEKNLLGVIMWGAGGATDVVSRAITPHVEPLLGQEIVLENKPGATGAISTQYVQARPSDGYTLLYGAENPQLHKVLGVAELDYADFYPVNILARGVGVIVANNDAPWQSFQDLVEDARSRPGAIKMGGTGPGGLPHVVGALLETVTEFEVTTVPFDGEGPGLTALLGGHVDFMPVGVSAAAEHIKAGRVRPLAVVASEELDMLPGVPPITQDYPDFGRYLPWGPFYGIFVKRDVPADVKARLVEAFEQGAATPEFQALMTERGNVMMNISGDEADAFLERWQSVTAWLLQDAGAAKVSPEEFGIPRP
jgi:tripartite-type tricarboxylate transporter receptor subunit TctC